MTEIEIKGPLPLSEDDLEYYLEHEGELYDFLDPEHGESKDATEPLPLIGDYDTLVEP